MLVVTALGVFGGVGLYMYKLMNVEPAIASAPEAVVTTVANNMSAMKRFDGNGYAISLPDDWESFTVADSIAGASRWHNTAGNKGVQVITVYIDADVQKLAINRLLPVYVAQNGIIPDGSASEKCINFASPDSTQPSTGIVTAKWQKVSFLCDTGNYVRDVVGIGTEDTLNGAVVTDNGGVQHTVFITYADDSVTPDFELFARVVRSFALR